MKKHHVSELEQLHAVIREFSTEREWEQFHNPKDLAIAISIEASELLELFLWKSPQEIPQTIDCKRQEIEEEVADIAIYLMRMIDVLGIDFNQAILGKIEKNRQKYPAEKVKGKNLKYDQFEN